MSVSRRLHTGSLIHRLHHVPLGVFETLCLLEQVSGTLPDFTKSTELVAFGLEQLGLL